MGNLNKNRYLYVNIEKNGKQWYPAERDLLLITAVLFNFCSKNYVNRIDLILWWLAKFQVPCTLIFGVNHKGVIHFTE